MSSVDLGALTESQAARRHRVVMTALDLAASGGYEAVQMRDVAAKADVALGTIYRYFTSKDHLLAAAMTEWVTDLERQVRRHPPAGASSADRVIDVLSRALKALGQRPQLARAVITALTSGDPEAGGAQAASTAAINRIMADALPEHVDPARLAEMSRTLGHVWFSCLVVWASGIQDLDWVSDEVSVAARLLLPEG